MQSGKGVLVLVLGILSLVGCGCLTGLPAWLIGNQALQESGDPSERTMIQIGRIIGMVVTILVLLGFVFWLVAVVFLGAFSIAMPR